LGGGRAGRADVAGGEDAVAPVKPAVGSELETVRDVVANGVGVEAVEEDLRFAVGNIVGVAIGNEKKFGRAKREHAPEAGEGAGELDGLIPKNGAFVGAAIVVSIFENNDAIAQVEVEVFGALRVSVILANPQAAAGVGGDVDGLLDVGLGGKRGGVEALRHFDGREGVGGFEEGDGSRFGVVRDGEVGGFWGREGERGENQTQRQQRYARNHGC
jgi:hypothetical protein